MFTFTGDVLLYLVYPVLAALLFIGARFVKKGGEYVEFMSLEQTKAIGGFMAVCIVLHHVAQEISVQRLFVKADARGLEPFYYSGYLFVSWFLFCSGFGLAKSFRTKENYLDGFASRRVLPVAAVYVVTELIYLIFRVRTDSEAFPANPYSWFIFTLVLLYAFYYFAFRKLKRGRIACVTVLVVLYCVFCRLFGFGEWWFNSAPLFVLGMLTAAREKKAAELIGKRSVLSIVSSAVLFAVFFALSRGSDALYRLFGGNIPYAVFREAVPFLQTVSGVFFCLFFAALGTKIRFGSKALAFLGGLTLEIYLIQGIFIRLFGKYLYDGETLSPAHIASRPLYALAVITAAVISAYAINKLCSIIVKFLRGSDFAGTLWKDAKKAALVIGILAVVVTLFYSISSHSKSANTAAKLDKYRDENITYVDSGGTEIAAYVTGSGDETIVLLRGDFDPSPCMSLRPLADALGDKYKAVVIDFPGQGFSGEAASERSADNIAAEINSALTQLGIDEPVVLLACDISGIYALKYIEKYPDKVSALIGIDAYIPEALIHLAAGPFSSGEEYTWALRWEAKSSALKNRLLVLTGYERIELSMLDVLFNKGVMRNNVDEISEMYIRSNYSDASVEEQGNIYQNSQSIRDEALPEDIPALFLLDEYYDKIDLTPDDNGKSTVRGIYENIITDTKTQKVDTMLDYYVIYMNPSGISEKIEKFLDSVRR